LSSSTASSPIATAEEIVFSILELKERHPSFGPQKISRVLAARLEAPPDPARSKHDRPRPPPVRPSDAMTPAEAKLRAAEIRGNAAFWRPSQRDPTTGLPAISPEAHAELVQKLIAYYRRAAEEN
jgi:hypothetical protein